MASVIDKFKVGDMVRYKDSFTHSFPEKEHMYGKVISVNAKFYYPHRTTEKIRRSDLITWECGGREINTSAYWLEFYIPEEVEFEFE